MRRVAGAVVLLVAACAHEQELPTRVVVFDHSKDHSKVETLTDVPPDPAVPFDGQAVSADTAPLPIHGGTLLIAGPYVWVASPDTGVVDVIDLESRVLHHSFALGAKSQPGRMAEDSTGAVSVVLRGEGVIATLDIASQTVKKRAVCTAPRGIASGKNETHVACATGELVTLSASGAKTITLGGDLRDVAIDAGGTIYVTRSRRAEILVLDADRKVQRTLRPREATDDFDRRQPNSWRRGGRFIPHVAWRMDRAVDGTVLVLHQYETTREVPIDKPAAVERTAPLTSPYGGIINAENLCGHGRLVVPAMTRLSNGAVVGSVRLGNSTSGTPFDFAANRNGALLAHTGGVITQATLAGKQVEPSCADDPTSERVLTGTPVAIAATNDVVVVQTRDPDAVVITGLGGAARVALSSPVSHDTGWALFHTTTSSGLACMTCHPDGTDDGHVWAFQSVGPRRTQSLHGGILATAPFHWSGDQKGMHALASDVFTKRMGGGRVTEKQSDALGKWLDRLPAPPKAKIDSTVATRGRSVFEGSGCAACHTGAHLTNNESSDVGTGGVFQVPSLVGVGARAPFMHDGCASTLAERFTKKDCGGTDHGSVKSLRANELFDLVSYLESL